MKRKLLRATLAAVMMAAMLPGAVLGAETVTLYALDGRTIQVWDYEVPAYVAVGWYETDPNQTQAPTAQAVTLYALDGRTIQVWDYEVPTYVVVGWYETDPNQVQAPAAQAVTLYAPDGRTIQVWDHEVPSYVAVGWYKTKPAASSTGTKSTTQAQTNGNYSYGTVYATKTGKKYHYSSSCNGGSYYPATWSEVQRRGLQPCAKCVY